MATASALPLEDVLSRPAPTRVSAADDVAEIEGVGTDVVEVEVEEVVL